MAIQPVPHGTGERSGRALSLVVRLALLPAWVGCASVPTSVELHPLDDPHGPQAVAVIATRDAPRSSLLAFARGNAEGAAKVVEAGAGGAAAGALTGLGVLLAAGPAAILALPLIGGIIAGGAAAGLVVGATAAAQAIVPEEQALAIEQIAASAVVQFQLPDLTATAVANGVKRSRGTRRNGDRLMAAHPDRTVIARCANAGSAQPSRSGPRRSDSPERAPTPSWRCS